MLRTLLNILARPVSADAPSAPVTGNAPEVGTILDTLSGASFPARDLGAIIRPDYVMGGACISVAAGSMPSPVWKLTVQTREGDTQHYSLSNHQRAGLLGALRAQVADDGAVTKIPLPRLG